MMRPVLMFFFLLGGLLMKAQSEKPFAEADTASLSVKKDMQLKAAQKNESPKDGATPAPEEQGFTKKVVNGKTVYYKEEGQLRVEYIPNH